MIKEENFKDNVKYNSTTKILHNVFDFILFSEDFSSILNKWALKFVITTNSFKTCDIYIYHNTNFKILNLQ